jgi:nucleoid DNA-binding protein
MLISNRKLVESSASLISSRFLPNYKSKNDSTPLHVYPLQDRANIKIIQNKFSNQKPTDSFKLPQIQKSSLKKTDFVAKKDTTQIHSDTQSKFKSKSKSSIFNANSFLDIGTTVIKLASSHKHALDSIKGLSSNDINYIWKSMSIYIRNQMENSKMVYIPGLGTFGVYEHRHKISNQISKVEKFPYFCVDLNFVRLHNLSYLTKPMTNNRPTVNLNYEVIAKLSGFSRDIVQRSLEYALLAISRQIRKSDNVILQLPELGTLTILNYNNGNMFKPHMSGDKLIQMIFNTEISKKVIEL